VDAIRQVFPCKLHEFPTKYLGAPLLLTRISRNDEQHIVDNVAARIPAWKGGLLTTIRRALLAQSTLSAIPVHVSICCCLSAWATEEIDCRRRAFLWARTDTVLGGSCRIAWPIVCAPKDHRGLGLPDLRILGYALRLRWEWMRRTEPSSAWAALPSASEHKVAAMFSSSIYVQVGDGASTKFWTDAWLPDGAISNTAPNLFKAVGRRRLGRTVKDALSNMQWVWDIISACIATVLLEYASLWATLENVQLRPLEANRFVWRWTTDGQYSVSSAYRAFFTSWTTLLGSRELWRANVSSKVKFFFWLALHGRLWTAERRKRHGLQPDATLRPDGRHRRPLAVLLRLR
jgi:hypothetical protein